MEKQWQIEGSVMALAAAAMSSPLRHGSKVSYHQKPLCQSLALMPSFQQQGEVERKDIESSAFSLVLTPLPCLCC